MTTLRRGLLAAAVATLPLTAAAEPGFVAIEVDTMPIETFSLREGVSPFGELTFMGGLVLFSDDDDFGALSGLDVADDGSFIAVADTGFWFTGRLIEEDGRLVGVADVARAPMLDADGEEANRKSSADAEGLRLTDGGATALVVFEQRHRLSAFATADLAFARPRDLPLPALPGLVGNRGIESVAVAPEGSALAGAIVLIAEAAGDGQGGTRAWIVGGPDPGAFSIRRSGTFDITDAAFLPNGDLFVLERRFSLSEGIAMRVRRFSQDDIRPGARITGQTIVFDDRLFQIDNMEGLAVREGADGAVILTLVSDDNHSLLQRTMLLQFMWQEEMIPLPLPRPEPLPDAEAAAALGGG
ncbi:MAG: esterase-like activity of phytase family protein [Bauldia sp.]|nr:esterase-like activity of phytase family protein [Bauldia sp.]